MSVFSLKIDIADNKFFNGETSPLFSQSQAKLARQFHQKIAGYRPTPLCALDDLANLFGVKKILVKDVPVSDIPDSLPQNVKSRRKVCCEEYSQPQKPQKRERFLGFRDEKSARENHRRDDYPHKVFLLFSAHIT